MKFISVSQFNCGGTFFVQLVISTIAFLMSDFHAQIDRKEAVPLLVSSCFVLLLHQFFSRGKLEIVPFLFFFIFFLA